jgi:uncharacterized protein YjbJ (UPF0337 family)
MFYRNSADIDSLGKISGFKSFSSSQGKAIMNKDQVTGVAKDIAGKVQESAGKLVGSKHQQAKGLEKQVEGKVEKSIGDAKEIVKDAVDKI